jgi:hypothetical protein
MDLFGLFKRFFTKKAQAQALQSINQSSINQSISESPQEPSLYEQPQSSEVSPPIELQKESIQLGLAAGYTGRALRDIERSLVRIESSMPSRDWFTIEFGDQKKVVELLESIRNILKIHDDLTMKHFEMLENTIYALQGIAQRAPEPVKTEILREIKTIEANLPPTPKMQQLINIVKQGEINYTNLANALGITESALRGLLTLTIRRTGAVQRFEKDGRGWVKPISTD